MQPGSTGEKSLLFSYYLMVQLGGEQQKYTHWRDQIGTGGDQ